MRPTVIALGHSISRDLICDSCSCDFGGTSIYQVPSNINSSCHTLQDLLTLDTSEKEFYLLHMNIRSHSPHHDELVSTLASLRINFDVIGVSETWNFFENLLKAKVDIPGYSYVSQQSHSQNGGVALYVKSGRPPIPRPDLERDSPDFESVGVEVENKNGKNYLFCCAYCHPNSVIDTFSEYLQDILSNPAVCNKQVFILGDLETSM